MSNSSNPHVFARVFCRKKKQNIDIASAEFEATFPKNVTDLKLYTCDLCESDLELRRTEHPRYRVKAYFAHKRSSSSCAGSTGESFKHLQAKFLLKRFVGAYDFCLEACTTCGPHYGFESFTTDTVHVELRNKISADKTYIYDICLARNLGKKRGKQNVLAIEVFHTHKTDEKKIYDTIESGLDIVEVDAQVLIGMQKQLEDAEKNNYRVTIPNLQIYFGTCKKCQRKEKKEEAQKQFDREFIFDCYTESTWKLRLQNDYQKFNYEMIETQERGKFLANQRYQKNVQRPSKKIKFSKENRKCKLCQIWQSQDALKRVSRYHWEFKEFEKMHQWHIDNFVELPCSALICLDCCVICDMCKMHEVPLAYARKHGVCCWCLDKLQKQKSYRICAQEKFALY